MKRIIRVNRRHYPMMWCTIIAYSKNRLAYAKVYTPDPTPYCKNKFNKTKIYTLRVYSRSNEYAHTHTHTCARVRTRARAHTHKHIDTHTHAHTHTHTHVQARTHNHKLFFVLPTTCSLCCLQHVLCAAYTGWRRPIGCLSCRSFFAKDPIALVMVYIHMYMLCERDRVYVWVCGGIGMEHRAAKTHRRPYLYRSFPAKEPYN